MAKLRCRQPAAGQVWRTRVDLRALVHRLTDDDLADHTSRALWIREPLPLDLSVTDPPGMNQGIARFGKADFRELECSCRLASCARSARRQWERGALRPPRIDATPSRPPLQTPRPVPLADVGRGCATRTAVVRSHRAGGPARCHAIALCMPSSACASCTLARSADDLSLRPDRDVSKARRQR
ncbi:MAG: hypothetical protein KGI87_04800 [Burkholderiales bacterium]|nr:hypothetical protein [Burkholderiales bacterium]